MTGLVSHPPGPSLNKKGLGFLTFAFGPVRFRKQAIALAQSLEIHAPGIPRACITDQVEDPSLKKWFQILIPLVPAYGKALQQKLHFDLYTPFAHTAFIDSDCLVTGSLAPILARCNGQPFAVLGIAQTAGWWYMDIAVAMEKYRLPFVPHFNGGFYYFERSEIASSVFLLARKVGRVHTRMGIYQLGGWFNEEVFYAFALAACHVQPLVDHTLTGMYTPDEFTDPFKIDVLEKGTHFNSGGLVHRPVITHFFGRTSHSFHYLRECAKLRWTATSMPVWLTRFWFDGVITRVFALAMRVYALTLQLQGKQYPFSTYTPFAPLSNFYTSITGRFFK